MSDRSRRFLFKKGRFFIIYRPIKKGWYTILLGPGGLYFLLVLFCLIFLSIINILSAYQLNSNSFNLTTIVSLICVISCMITGMIDPGIIWNDKHDSYEKDIEESSSTSIYCSICGTYRPANANHCITCNVCYEDWDHHCSFFG